MSDTIYAKIIRKEIPADIVYEDESCVAFRDIQPQAPVHVLVVPRKPIPTHDEITEADAALIGHIHTVLVRLAQELGLAEGYRVVVNCRAHGGQEVDHLHFHLLGGRPMKWPPG
jgi:histidine triad (HIT) family protein